MKKFNVEKMYDEYLNGRDFEYLKKDEQAVLNFLSICARINVICTTEDIKEAYKTYKKSFKHNSAVKKYINKNKLLKDTFERGKTMRYYNLKKDKFYCEKAYQYYCKKIGIEKVKTQKGWVDNEFVIFTLLDAMSRMYSKMTIKEAREYTINFLQNYFHFSQEEIDNIDILNL